MGELRPELRSRGVLDVFLGTELLGRLEDRTLGYVAFDFAEQAILDHGAGSRLLSLSMPMSFETVDPFIATAFFAGLLPEGAARQRLADEFRIGTEDTWALLQVLGRESAGALVILPEGDRPVAPGNVALQPLTEERLAVELDALTVSPLGVTVRTEEVRLSLAGVQDKLPLVRLETGALALPVAGHPSNLIAKPERDRAGYPGLVANEAFCLTVSAELESRRRASLSCTSIWRLPAWVACRCCLSNATTVFETAARSSVCIRRTRARRRRSSLTTSTRAAAARRSRGWRR